MDNYTLEREDTNMNITVGQFNVKSKDIKHNYNQMVALVTKAKQDNYDVIVFGEYALTGYACASLFQQSSFYEEVEHYTKLLLPLSKEITIIFGSIRKEANKSYVCATILNNEEITYSDKETLNKREFDETVYFTAGVNQSFNDYLVTFKADMKDQRKQIVLDSSPVNQTLDLKTNTVYANTLGNSQVNKVIFINGGNSYVNLNEKLEAINLQEGLVSDNHKLKESRKLEALVKGIQSFSNDNFGTNKKWLVGNSGGLDSAVTISLLSIALGSESVITYNLKSRFNSDKTVNNAQHLADALNIKHHSYSIEEAVSGYMKTLSGFGYDEVETLAYENIQARTRGHLLGGFSSIENAVISNNGNKLEIMLGYATLYGDTIGALSSIGDLVKVEVFELAHEINEYLNKEVIPTNLLPQVKDYTLSFEMPPSAELKSDQVDPMKWYYHDLLCDLILTKSKEEILSMYLDNQFEDLEIGKWLPFYELDQGTNFVEDFNWFTRTFEINNFKRMQMPPVLAYSNKVIGVDYIETPLLRSKTIKQEELEAAIIKKY